MPHRFLSKTPLRQVNDLVLYGPASAVVNNKYIIAESIEARTGVPLHKHYWWAESRQIFERLADRVFGVVERAHGDK